MRLIRLSAEAVTALCLHFVKFRGPKEKHHAQDSLPARFHSHTREGDGGDSNSHRRRLTNYGD